jgi:serine/threonine-protein kinase SRK2
MGSAADYLEDPLFGHTRYRKIKDLNEGTFGIVLLALDVRTNEQVLTILLPALPHS